MDSVIFNNIFLHKINILHEQRGDMSLKEYHDHAKENDPTYLSWLLGDHIGEYGSGMTTRDYEVLSEFEDVIHD